MKKSDESIHRNAQRLAMTFKSAEQAQFAFDPIFRRVVDLLMAEAAKQVTVVGGPIHTLSGRQRDVLRLVVHGHSNKQIAKHLGISEASVKIHIQAMLLRLGVANRTAAAAMGAVSFMRSDIREDIIVKH